MKNRAPVGRRAGRGSGRATREGEVTANSRSLSLGRPELQREAALCLDPATIHRRVSGCSPDIAPGSRRTNGWPAPGARARNPQRLPNRGGCLTAQPPRAGSSRCTAASASANPQPRTAARARNPPLTCRLVRARELRREPARRLVRRAPGRKLQRFLSGARLESCSLGRCLITQRRREMTIGL